MQMSGKDKKKLLGIFQPFLSNVLSQLFPKETFCNRSIGISAFVNWSNKTFTKNTKIGTDTHTPKDRQRDLETESAQWADSVKITQKYLFQKRKKYF